MSLATASRHLVVIGDVVIDRHLYAGERASPAMRDHRGVREKKERGGADLLRRLLEALFAATPGAAAALRRAGWRISGRSRPR